MCTKRGGGVAGCCKLLGAGILFSCSCPHSSGHNVPVNLQQDNCYFLFCNFLISMWMEKCYTFKGQALDAEPWERILCIFQAVGDIPLQRCRASRTKQRQQSTKVRAKGIDPTWSQACSSLLQFPTVHVHSTILRDKGWWPLWLLPAERGQGGGDGGMEFIILELEVFPSPRLGISSLHHEDTAPPFHGPVITLRQALEHIYKLQHLGWGHLGCSALSCLCIFPLLATQITLLKHFLSNKYKWNGRVKSSLLIW